GMSSRTSPSWRRGWTSRETERRRSGLRLAGLRALAAEENLDRDGLPAAARRQACAVAPSLRGERPVDRLAAGRGPTVDLGQTVADLETRPLGGRFLFDL